MDYKTGGIFISEFVKKTIVGYKPVNGSSDPECTHVILTLDEYDELHQRVRAAINGGKRAKEEASHAAAVSVANAETAVKKIQEDAAQKIAQLQSNACRSAVCDVEGLQRYRGEDIQCQRKGWILGDQHYAHETT